VIRTDNRRPVAIALCADDYAIAPGVDRGILSLAERGRITAFSCLTVSPRWPEAAKRIKPLFGLVDIGLHFALTQFAPLGPMPKLAPGGRLPQLGPLYLRAILRRLDLGEVEAELNRQIDVFHAALGSSPDFLDGHHHVHQLPGVRDVVARVWKARAPAGWVRNTATSPARIFRRAVAIPRAALLSTFGRGAKRTWLAAGILTNADFAGVRSFGEPQLYRHLMQRYMSGARERLLIMCHPGEPDAALAAVDPVVSTRAQELAYLAGDEFSADLDAAGCRLVRLSSLVGR
jgi:predicted glycoside hydrolase/deacetylase ChbG (UPF0249 family)